MEDDISTTASGSIFLLAYKKLEVHISGWHRLPFMAHRLDWTINFNLLSFSKDSLPSTQDTFPRLYVNVLVHSHWFTFTCSQVSSLSLNHFHKWLTEITRYTLAVIISIITKPVFIDCLSDLISVFLDCPGPLSLLSAWHVTYFGLNSACRFRPFAIALLKMLYLQLCLSHALSCDQYTVQKLYFKFYSA